MKPLKLLAVALLATHLASAAESVDSGNQAVPPIDGGAAWSSDLGRHPGSVLDPPATGSG